MRSTLDELVYLARARARQEAGSERLVAIREKLERARAATRGEADLVEDFARRLLANEPATAQQQLLRTGREVELRREEHGRAGGGD